MVQIATVCTIGELEVSTSDVTVSQRHQNVGFASLFTLLFRPYIFDRVPTVPYRNQIFASMTSLLVASKFTFGTERVNIRRCNCKRYVGIECNLHQDARHIFLVYQLH